MAQQSNPTLINEIPSYYYNLTQCLTPTNRDRIMQMIESYPTDDFGNFKKLLLFKIAIGDSNVTYLLDKLDTYDPELDLYMSILIELNRIVVIDKLCRTNDKWLHRLLYVSICSRNLSMLKRICYNTQFNKTFWSDETYTNVLLEKAIHNENLDATVYFINLIGFAHCHLQFIDLINKLNRYDLFDLVLADVEFNNDKKIQHCIFTNSFYLGNIIFIQKLLKRDICFDIDPVHINPNHPISVDIDNYKKYCE